MHTQAQPTIPSFPYPSPPYISNLDDSPTAKESNLRTGTSNSNMAAIDGVGVLNYQRAIDIARNTEGDLDPSVSAYLEAALQEIWDRIQAEPETYVMSKDEFAVFNYFRHRTQGDEVAEQAVARYWAQTGQASDGKAVLGALRGIMHLQRHLPMQRVNPRPDISARSAHPSRAGALDQAEDVFRQVEHSQSSSIYKAHEAGPLIVLPKTQSFSRQLSIGILTLCVVLLLWLDPITVCPDSVTLPSWSTRLTLHRPRATTPALLEVFQVYPPVLTVRPDAGLEINATVDAVPSTKPTCQETLVTYSFANSYGQPYVGSYEPPSCSFNRVTWNLTVVGAGRQFDRLASVSFGDVELFRTSTAEPTLNGIKWTYLKDMTNFLPLFKERQSIIFDLGNIVDDTYTSPFNVTLTSAFFTATDSIEPADLILPISTRQGAAGQPSRFTVPPDTASVGLTIPQNTKKAVITISATGQAAEEFWWSNVPQSRIDTFPSYGELYGYSPFREVQLFIDGKLAGIAWPFPIIFTGGVVPGLWRPVVGIDAFDLREDEIDITPWLPLLCDGKAHNFTVRVSGLNDDGNGAATLSETTLSNWWVSGKVFIWLDQTGHVTTGEGPYATSLTPDFQVTSQVVTSANGTNETLLYSVTAQRQVFLQSTLQLSTGKEIVSWSQSLTYSNEGNYTDQGDISTNQQQTTAYDISSSGYAKRSSYSLYAYTTYVQDDDGFTLFANVNRGKDVKTVGQPVFPTGLESFSGIDSVAGQQRQFQGASLSTTQNGTASYGTNQTAKTSYSFGTTAQDMTFSGSGVAFPSTQQLFPSITQMVELFHRSVLAVNGSVTEDHETLVGRTMERPCGPPTDDLGVALSGFPGKPRLAFGNMDKR